MTTKHIPPLLSPYLTLPTYSSLTLLTGTLDATTNWLVLRFLGIGLADRRAKSWDDGENAAEEGEVGVVLVSFLRGYEFWRGEGLRAVGFKS
jgi:elongator complex protein 6